MTVMILDGGMGQELIKRSGDKPTPLWATQVMLDFPGLVAEIHKDYFHAGAEIATANTYAILRNRLAFYDLEDKFEAFLNAAMDEAHAARDAHGSGRVAASLGPLKASYRPDLFPEHEEGVAEYRELVDILAPRADFLIAETVASLDHARAVLEAAHGHPIWLSITVDDEDGTKFRSGDAVAELAPILKATPPEAVLVNCSAPEAINQTIPVMKAFGVPFGGSANGFTEITKAFLGEKPTVEALKAREDITPKRYADFAEGWAAQGATLIGGCCEVGPAHIAELKDRFG